MSNADDALTAVAAARNERDRSRARSYFEAAITAAEAWRNEAKGDFEADLFRARVLSEYAAEENSPQTRLHLYQRGLGLIETTWKVNQIAKVAETHSLVSIDLFQDPIVSLDTRRKQTYLRQSREMLDIALRSTSEPKETAQLLARKSAILRHQAQLELTNDLMLKRVDEAVACALKATSTGHFPAAYLELGLAEWARARFEKTDEKYVEYLRRAEEHLHTTAEHVDDNARLTLARFYRMNYRPLEACEAFPTDPSEIKGMRKVLRESYLFGEAATQLWFAGTPSELLDEKLETARRLLNLSIAAGNRNARSIVSLGFITAILDGPSAGDAALSEISDSAHNVSWSDAVTLAASATNDKLASLGFALGIGNSQVWSSLGTYANTFMKDQALVETLYREAVQVDPGNAIALTNLARFLANTGSTEELLEARKLITRASSLADRRFFWWRDVRSQIDERVAATSGSTPSVPAARKAASGKVRSFKEVPAQFEAISQIENTQQRGYLLEALFIEVAALEFVVANASYRIQRLESLVQQVDGYFEHRVNKYRVECKWTASPMDKNDVVLFHAKLDAAGVDGVFVSMAGFTESAIAQAKLLAAQKAILFVDGSDITEVFQLRSRLGDLLSIKRQYFDMRTVVYHQLTRETAVV
jgi:TPR repeat protein